MAWKNRNPESLAESWFCGFNWETFDYVSEKIQFCNPMLETLSKKTLCQASWMYLQFVSLS